MKNWLCTTLLSFGLSSLSIAQINPEFDFKKFSRETYINRARQSSVRDPFIRHASMLIYMRYSENPGFSPETMKRELNELEKQYNKTRKVASEGEDYKAVPENLYQIKNDGVRLIKSVTGLRENKILEIADALYDTSVHVGEALYSPVHSNDVQNRSNEVLSTIERSAFEQSNRVFDKLYDISHDNPLARGIEEERIAPRLNGARAHDAANEILENDPEFANNEALRGYFGDLKLGKYPTSEDLVTLKKAFVEEMKKLRVSIDENTKAIKAASGEPSGQVEYYMHAENAIRGITLLIGLKDPKLAGQLSTIGVNAVRIASSIQTMASKGMTALLTGDVLGALSSIIGAIFGGPSMDEIILQELREFRKEMADFREETRERFDRIDLTLYVMQVRMLDSFDAVLTGQEISNQKISQVRETVLSVLNDVSSVDQKLSGYFADLNNHFIRDLMIDCDPAQKNRDDASYHRCLKRLKACAVNDASAAAFAGSASLVNSKDSPMLSLAAVANEFSSVAPEKQINILGRIYSQLEQQPVVDIVNPHVWAMCAERYMQLAQSWPSFSAYNSTEEIRQMEQAANELRGQVAKFRSKEFVSNLFAAYVEPAAVQYHKALQDYQKNFERVNVKGYDVLKGSNQLATNVNVLLNEEIGPCAGANLHGAVPEGPNLVKLGPVGGDIKALNYSIPDVAKILYDLEGGEGLKVCWLFARWTNGSFIWERPDAPEAKREITRERRNHMVGYENKGGFVTEENGKFYELVPLNHWLLRGFATVRVQASINGKVVWEREITSPDMIQFEWRRYKYGKHDGSSGEPNNYGNVRKIGPELLRFWHEQGGNKTILKTPDSNPDIPANLDEFRKIVDLKLAGAKKALINEMQAVVRNGSDASIELAARRLRAARNMVESYVRLAFQTSWMTDDILRSGLRGKNRIFDPSDLIMYDYVRDVPIFSPMFLHDINARSDALLNSIEYAIDTPQEDLAYFSRTLVSLGNYGELVRELRPDVGIEDALSDLRNSIQKVLDHAQN